MDYFSSQSIIHASLLLTKPYAGEPDIDDGPYYICAMEDYV